MLVKDVNACAFDKWYQTFKKVTFRSIILTISPDLLQYLREDGSLVLPVECEEKPFVIDRSNSDSEDEEGDSNSKWSDEEEGLVRPSFPEFHQSLVEAIDELGGCVFPKLNWSAPKDSAWIGFGNSLKCTSPSQVWLLLKSSDFISHDLTQPYKDTEDVLSLGDAFQEPSYKIVLRAWKDINPGFEFRCFVKSGSIIGISQRDKTHFYNHIRQDEGNILNDIISFYEEHIKDRFELRHFVFDVVRFSKDRVKLVDFNPFGPTTDPILFSWDWLEQHRPDSDHDIDFRFVMDDAGIQPSDLRHYSMPKDIVDIAAGSDHEKMVDFLKMQAEMQKKEDE